MSQNEFRKIFSTFPLVSVRRDDRQIVLPLQWTEWGTIPLRSLINMSKEWLYNGVVVTKMDCISSFINRCTWHFPLSTSFFSMYLMST